MTRDDWDWREASECHDVEPESFFAARGRPATDALAPCVHCPVKGECLDLAVASPWQPYGVWGGLPSKEVRALWRDQHPHDQRSGVEQIIGLRSNRSIS